MSVCDYFPNVDLTQDQKNALGAIEDFLSNDIPVFLLTGYAGTGKTTLLKGVCHYLKDIYRPFSLMASTGRAAQILSQRVGMPASTIHRAIYNLQELFEENEGTSYKYYYKVKDNFDCPQQIYIIDEASMISDAYSDQEFFRFGSGFLLRDLFQYVFGNSVKRKIIFIGDNAQLPPVGMSFSPALDKKYILEKYQLKSQEGKLTIVMRQQEDSNLVRVAQYLRSSIDNGFYNNFKIFDGRDILKIKSDEAITHYMREIQSAGPENCVILAHSNRQALEYNNKIRNERFGNDPGLLHENDLLIIIQNNYNQPIELYNGTFVQVVRVGGIVYNPEIRFKVKGGMTVSRSLTFRELSLRVVGIDGRFHVLDCLLLEESLTSEKNSLDPYYQRALYIDFKNRMREKDITPKHIEFKNHLKTDRVFNAVQAKYGYAITCHKSQGGEWPKVMVDFDVFMGKQTAGFFRWAYTAVSRATRQLYAVNAADFSAMTMYHVKDILQLKKVLPGMYHVSENSQLDFVEYRKVRLQKLCDELSVDIETKRFQNQLEVLCRNGNHEAIVRLWFSSKGFTKTTWEKIPEPAFKMMIEAILFESLLSSEPILFESKFPFQQKMKEFFLDVLKEENVPLTNIVQHEWSDEYFFKTRADCAAVQFFYNKNGVFTYAQPKSTLGVEDKQLQSIVSRLNGIKE